MCINQRPMKWVVVSVWCLYRYVTYIKYSQQLSYLNQCVKVIHFPCFRDRYRVMKCNYPIKWHLDLFYNSSYARSGLRHSYLNLPDHLIAQLFSFITNDLNLKITRWLSKIGQFTWGCLLSLGDQSQARFALCHSWPPSALHSRHCCGTFTGYGTS